MLSIECCCKYFLIIFTILYSYLSEAFLYIFVFLVLGDRVLSIQYVEITYLIVLHTKIIHHIALHMETYLQSTKKKMICILTGMSYGTWKGYSHPLHQAMFSKFISLSFFPSWYSFLSLFSKPPLLSLCQLSPFSSFLPSFPSLLLFLFSSWLFILSDLNSSNQFCDLFKLHTIAPKLIIYI